MFPRVSALAALLLLTMCTRAKESSTDPRAVAAACASLDAEIERAYRERECRTDGDCVTRRADCSCDQVVARSAEARIDALTRDWKTKGCALVGAPRTCPTCVPPPVPVCRNGICEPREP